MVHKTSNTVLDSGLLRVEKPRGIHKYKSTSSWLDEYDNQVDKMHKQLDKSYEESTQRQKEVENRIKELREEEWMEKQREEDQLHQEQMRQLQIEHAKAEVKAIKSEIERKKRPPIPVPIVTEIEKPTLKQKVVQLGKKVAGIVGTIAGHPEVAVAGALVPEPPPKKVKKTTYKYSPEGELIYGSW